MVNASGACASAAASAAARAQEASQACPQPAQVPSTRFVPSSAPGFPVGGAAGAPNHFGAAPHPLVQQGGPAPGTAAPDPPRGLFAACGQTVQERAAYRAQDADNANLRGQYQREQSAGDNRFFNILVYKKLTEHVKKNIFFYFSFKFKFFI